MPKDFTYKDKTTLRRELKAIRADIADKQEREAAAVKTALDMLRGNVLVYISIGSELSTDRLIAALMRRADVKVYAPHTVSGIITPRLLLRADKPDSVGNLPLDCYGAECGAAIDFCVTPLLGFNGDGFRIGYGAGCYDRYFAREKTAVRVGLAFDCQRVDFINETHDVPLDCCITESGMVYFSKR